MSELGNPHIESGGVPEQESLESLVPGVDLESFRDQIQDIQKTPELYQRFLGLIRENTPIKGGIQFRKIINRIHADGIDKTKDGIDKTKDGIDKTKDGIDKREEELINEKRERSKIAARESTRAIEDISISLSTELKGQLDREVEKQLQDIQSGQVSDATSGFLKSIGINSPADIQNPENQVILRARISTEVYLDKAQKDPEFRTQFSKEIEVLERNAPTLGIEQSTQAKNVDKLLSDIPQDTRGQVVDTVTSLTKSNPDTIVTRSGDTLSWEGTKKGEKYEIDMNVRPPKLSKSLGGLSISYEKQPDNPKLEGITEEVKTASNSLAEVKNDTQNKLKNGGFYRDIGKYSTEDLQKFLNNTSVFPNFKEQFQGADINTLQSLQAELSEKVAGATNDMERDILSYMVLAVDGKIKQHEQVKSTGIGELSMISEDEKVAMKHIETLTSQDTRDGLEKYITARKDLEAKQDKLKDIRTPGVEDFDQDASDTLNHLCDIGYDELGQELMDKVIGAVNLKNGWKGYKGEIDLNKKPKLEKLQAQELVSALSRLLNANNQSDNFPTNYSDAYSVLRKNRSQIQQIRKRFEENEQIRKNWKNNETLSKYIYSEKSKSATT